MRVLSLVLILPALALCFSPARADNGIIVVQDGGVAQDCYLATLHAPERLPDSLALNTCEQAVDDSTVSPRDRAASAINRAYLELRLQQYEGVLADSDRSIALAPQLPEGWLNRGAALVGLGRYDEALPALDKSLAAGLEKQEAAYLDIGMAKEGLHDVRGAYENYKKAADLDPHFQLAADEVKRFTVTTSTP